ncbi:vacuolar iron transporter Ccc1 [Sporothrix schenckii 1099-18]|uniref:Uncharacterized protein n=2 Tax=Sporothrix schenckii TaxID=29908 RepID=U7PXX2_SPOS1|nr:vacuolar iron transporter Ccc1 [Sporothrix schenckii 1099-18]ERT00484.1 hypothetical protein HMPREF1624_03857 [Sporothrix schenckii ATCC 58251]KJR85019.1 vacuolar iron transporter Ccc1 [Sporothrix schenckii 1099-18]
MYQQQQQPASLSPLAWTSSISPAAPAESQPQPRDARHRVIHSADSADSTVGRRDGNYVGTKVQRHAPRWYLPTARRFRADFTLGFSDGLTVPFAMTAGLSSLGQTDTVIYAGMAELTAGCISMGIGGYLSARQASTPRASEKQGEADDTDTDADMATVATRYIAPLGLPAHLRDMVLAHVVEHPESAEAILVKKGDGHADDGDDDDDDYDYDYVWPVASGLSVALGYLVGGLIPLGPYFFVRQVGDGLRWSIGVCIVALFLFGFVQDVARDRAAETAKAMATGSTRRLWKSIGEGVQMVVLGGIAASAAVLCVRLFDDASS